MATPAPIPPSEPATPTTTQQQQAKPSMVYIPRNPAPLSAAQEQQVRDLYYKRVRTLCADEIRDFATCALNRTVSATWACRQQKLAMNACMVRYATQEEQDRAREQWFLGREARAKAREEKERKRVEQERFHREWWGLDERERKRRIKAGEREPVLEGK